MHDPEHFYFYFHFRARRQAPGSMPCRDDADAVIYLFSPRLSIFLPD